MDGRRRRGGIWEDGSGGKGRLPGSSNGKPFGNRHVTLRPRHDSHFIRFPRLAVLGPHSKFIREHSAHLLSMFELPSMSYFFFLFLSSNM